MALHYNTLGGGAAHSGTAAPGRYEELNVCTGCGFDATTAMEGKDGLTYAVCADCEVTLREQEEAAHEWCADCGKVPAERRFVHLTKGEFWLCASCWMGADHEDDYLEVCTCGVALYHQVEGQSFHCLDCARPVKHVMHCQCPRPSTAADHPNYCAFCQGAVVHVEDEEDYDRGQEPEYDWGEEQEGDFPAEESEPESDDGRLDADEECW